MKQNIFGNMSFVNSTRKSQIISSDISNSVIECPLYRGRAKLRMYENSVDWKYYMIGRYQNYSCRVYIGRTLKLFLIDIAFLEIIIP